MKKKCSQFISAVVKIGSGPLQLKTLYTGIQAYYIIKYIKTTTTLWKWSRKGSNSLPVYISLLKQTKSNAKIRLHVWNDKKVFFIIYVLVLECFRLYINCIFSDHICVLNLKNKMCVPRQVIEMQVNYAHFNHNYHKNTIHETKSI